MLSTDTFKVLVAMRAVLCLSWHGHQGLDRNDAAPDPRRQNAPGDPLHHPLRLRALQLRFLPHLRLPMLAGLELLATLCQRAGKMRRYFGDCQCYIRILCRSMRERLDLLDLTLHCRHGPEHEA